MFSSLIETIYIVAFRGTPWEILGVGLDVPYLLLLALGL